MVREDIFKIGEKETVQTRVTIADTALNYGSGKLDKLFATPSLVALMIEASSRLLDNRLPEGFITVGRTVSVTHEKPTVLGEMVTVKVEIVEFNYPRVLLKMEAFDEVGKIGEGEHERFVVKKDILMSRADKRESEVMAEEHY